MDQCIATGLIWLAHISAMTGHFGRQNGRWLIVHVSGNWKGSLPLITAWKKLLWREICNSCEALDGFWSASVFFQECFLSESGGRRECDLWCGSCCWSAEVGSKGLIRLDSISGVFILCNEEDRKELLNLVNVGVPRNPMLGDCKLPYISMDCLKFKNIVVVDHWSINWQYGATYHPNN